METTLEHIKSLSQSAKMMLMDAIVVYPNTESIAVDIARASQLGILIPYSNLDEDITKIENLIAKEPRFNQLSSRALNVEVLRLMLFKSDLNYNSVDYVHFQRIKTPTLCLQNSKNEHQAKGVSIVVDLDDARARIHRFLSYPGKSSELINNLGKSLPIAIAIVIAGFIISHAIPHK
eukprot:gene27561-33287_t